MDMDTALLLSILAATVQSGTPILYATLGEMFTERSGVLNLGVEGMMIVGAFTAFLATHLTGNPWAGVLAAGLCGAGFRCCTGWSAWSFRATRWSPALR